MKRLKTILIGTVLMLFISGAAYSQYDINDIQKAIGDFADEIHESVPFYSTLGLNWSDAYIGKFFPSLPPHFGVGINAGFTTFGSGAFKSVLNAVGAGGALPAPLENIGAPLLGYTVEARLGGIVLPFDIGVKLGILPLDLSDYSIDYLLVGADIRYAVLDKPLSPIKVSIGVGYNHLKGGIRVPLGSGFDLDLPGSETITMSDPKLGFLWGTDTIELKGQVSLKLPFITPYAGAGISVAFTHAGYEFKSDLGGISDAEIGALSSLGITGISNSGFQYIDNNTSFNMRLFGGISFNLTVVRFDFSVLYNMIGGQFGASFGTRIQI